MPHSETAGAQGRSRKPRLLLQVDISFLFKPALLPCLTTFIPHKPLPLVFATTVYDVRFVQIFVQSEEGVAHDGSKLDTWLEDMLSEMQHSIEQHLSDVFKSDTNNP